MRRLFCDFETYYAQDYSLRQLTQSEYILDPRFEALGAALAWDDQPSFWVDGPALQAYFDTVDWSQVAMVSHNIQFDGSVLAWIFNCVPALYVDTLGMSRALIYHEVGANSLDKVSQYLGFGQKGTAIVDMKGYRFREFRANADLYRRGIEYALDDNDKCRKIYTHLRGEMPRDEWLVVDMLIRMITQPQFVADRAVLQENYTRVLEDKAKLMARVGMIETTSLMSNDMFAFLLEDLGIEPPKKISLKTNKETWAFSKQDHEFKALLEHDNPDVQALVAARLGVKSTQDETRSRKFLAVSDASERFWGDCWFPMPLKYSGAHTHRLSGDWGLNVQNLPRADKLLCDNGGKPLPHKLRYALKAPPGYVVVQVDAAQIEARVVSWMARCMKLVNAFANKQDVYAMFASTIYGFAIDKNLHPLERFVGKTGILGLGFGMAGVRFKDSLRSATPSVNLTLPESERVVSTYRTEYPEIPELWNKAEALLPFIQEGLPTNLGPLHTRKDEIILPNGHRLRYKNLRREMRTKPGQERARMTWVYDWGRQTKTLFGGKVVENFVQALARIMTMEVAVRLRRRFPQYRLALQIHDALVYIVKVEDAAWFTAEVVNEMRIPPSWAADCPLDAEGGWGATLADAK